MTQWGYARVSRVDQDPAPQFDALRRAGVDEAQLVVDHASGSQDNRPGLTRLLEQLEAGDVLTVWKLDRLGRSLPHLIAIIDSLGERGVEFRSLTDPIDTTTPGGRLLFAVIGAVAQFERELIAERTKAALITARERNATLGRPTQVHLTSSAGSANSRPQGNPTPRSRPSPASPRARSAESYAEKSPRSAG